jgi:hypothetical protein
MAGAGHGHAGADQGSRAEPASQARPRWFQDSEYRPVAAVERASDGLYMLFKRVVAQGQQQPPTAAELDKAGTGQYA